MFAHSDHSQPLTVRDDTSSLNEKRIGLQRLADVLPERKWIGATAPVAVGKGTHRIKIVLVPSGS